MMRQMFSIGERSGLQAGQFSTRTLLLWSHAVVIAAVCGFALSCWNTQGLPWNRRRLEGSICCSKTFIYLSAFIVPSKTCKLPIPYALMHPHTIRDAVFWTERWWHAGRSPSSYPGGHGVCDFQQEVGANSKGTPFEGRSKWKGATESLHEGPFQKSVSEGNIAMVTSRKWFPLVIMWTLWFMH